MSEFTSTFKPAPVKPIVAFAALEALDIRVGTILKVEEVARSEKLMKLTVSFGDHTRTILAGMRVGGFDLHHRGAGPLPDRAAESQPSAQQRRSVAAATASGEQ